MKKFKLYSKVAFMLYLSIFSFVSCTKETVKLSITDNNNIPGGTFLPGSSLFTADFSFNQTAPLNARFINTSQNATQYSWDFGDGSALSAEVNPIHRYNNSGIYKVTLVASNAVVSDTITKDIVVNNRLGFGIENLTAI